MPVDRFNNATMNSKAMLDAYLRQQIIASSLRDNDHEDDGASQRTSDIPQPIEMPDGAALAVFKGQVHAFMDIDDKVRKLQACVKELNREKRGMSEQILAFMRKYNIEELNTRNGKLRYKMTHVAAPMSQKELKNRFISNYDTNKTADEIVKCVFDTREKIAKASLKRLPCPGMRQLTAS